MVNDPDRAIVRQLCAEVLAAEISLDDLQARRPAKPSDPFLEQVLDDLEDAVEHTPGRLLRRGPDQAAWKRSPEYLTVYADWCLLDERTAGVSGDELLRWRAAIEAAPAIVSTDDVQRKVDSLLEG
jgi:hypothetical protein